MEAAHECAFCFLAFPSARSVKPMPEKAGPVPTLDKLEAPLHRERSADAPNGR